jgi:hypothetical protein
MEKTFKNALGLIIVLLCCGCQKSDDMYAKYHDEVIAELNNIYSDLNTEKLDTIRSYVNNYQMILVEDYIYVEYGERYNPVISNWEYVAKSLKRIHQQFGKELSFSIIKILYLKNLEGYAMPALVVTASVVYENVETSEEFMILFDRKTKQNQLIQYKIGDLKLRIGTSLQVRGEKLSNYDE